MFTLHAPLRHARLALSITALAAVSASAQGISGGLLGAGGGTAADDAYRLTATFGEPIVGYTAGGAHRLGSGFWATPRMPAALLLPAAPALVAPADGAAELPTTVAFTWEAVPDAATYEFQLATAADFSALALEETDLGATTFEAAGLDAGAAYYWRVRAANAAGAGPYSAAFSFTTQPLVSTEDGGGPPEAFALHGVYPNPFGPRAMLRYDVPEAARVRIVLYDVLGRAVARIVDGPRPPGRHTATLEGRHLPNGVYFARMTAGAFVELQRVTRAR